MYTRFARARPTSSFSSCGPYTTRGYLVPLIADPSRSFQMPYFIRRPHTPASTPRETNDRSAEVDILELAKGVLASESGEGETRPFRIREPLRPGGLGAMILELALDRGWPARTINLAASDLVGTSSRIGSGSVRISPAILTVSTGAPADITVTVQAPPGARPGLYVGTVTATGDESFVIPFQVEVR
jgi:hypothetical protein